MLRMHCVLFQAFHLSYFACINAKLVFCIISAHLVRLANRERGCGERILLDQRLRLLDARSSTIEGYAQEHFGEQSVSHLIEVGASDVAVAREALHTSASCLRFTPLQDEWIDMVVVKTEYTRPLIRLLRSLMSDTAFKNDMRSLDEGNVDALGVILYES